MGYTVEVELDVDVAPEIAFDTLADHDSWRAWMPRSFAPMGPSLGTLRAGMRPRVRIDRLPVATPIAVTLVDRPRAIVWGGGSALLRAEHRFTFEARAEGGTKLRSSEKWSGLLARALSPLVKRAAARIGREQLEAIANEARRRAR
jgi:hypothetical protein